MMSNTFQIKDFAKVKGGKRLPKGNLVQDQRTDHPYLRVTDMRSDGIDLTNIKYITKQVYEKVKRYTIASDDAYISIAGTIGYVGKIPPWLSGSNLTENAAKITEINKDLIDQDFLIQFLRSRLGQFEIKSKTGGSSQPKLALSRIEKINIPKIPITQQKKISSVLNAYSALIDANERRAKILEEMAQRLYTEWFGKFKFPGHEKVKIVNSSLGKIPKEWTVGKLGDIVDLIMGLSPKSKFYNSIEEGLPLLNGAADFNGESLAPSRFSSQITRKAVRGDIIFCIRATIGNITEADQEYCLGRGVAALRKKEGIPNSFVILTLKRIIDSLINISSGSTIKGIKKEDISNFKIILPTNDILSKFSTADDYLKLKAKLQRQNQLLVSIRDLLIPQLVTGKRKLKN